MTTAPAARTHPDRRRAASHAATGLALLLAAGCSGLDGRCGAEGRVTFDGRPVEEGVIVLVPAAGAAGPTAGAEIRGGRYAIPAACGPLAGRPHRVEITGYRKTGRRLPEVPGGPPAYDEKVNFIPGWYNVASTLVVTPAATHGVAALDFDLTAPRPNGPAGR